MGMNIYTKSGKHIGKRSAAGLWCWDCRVEVGLLDHCPECGREDENRYNPVMKELGFDEEHHKPAGVDGASKFMWQVGDDGIGENIVEVVRNIGRYKLETEYGEELSTQDFVRMFDYVITHDFISNEFS